MHRYGRRASCQLASIAMQSSTAKLRQEAHETSLGPLRSEPMTRPDTSVVELARPASGFASSGAPRKSYLAKGALIGIGLFVALLLLEVGLRIAGVVHSGSFFTGDLVRGWGLRPGAHAWAIGEAKVYVQINSDGLRDREHAIQKPAGTLRIAVLGDSYVEAMNVPLEKTFPAVLERELSSCVALGHRQVEVINFGVSGYGTAQELLTLREHAWKYDPDIILLAFYTGNDFFNNYRALNPVESEQYPYFVYDDNSLVLDNSFRRSWKMSKAYNWFFNFRGEIQNHSRVFQVFMEAIKDLKTKSAERDADRSIASLGLGDLEDIIYYSPVDPRMREAWHVTEGILLLMRDDVRSHGAEFWMATLANRPQLNPDPNQQQAFMKRLGISTLFYPDQRLRTFAQEAGIPTITLAPEMSAYAETHHVFLNGGHNIPFGTGHWNEDGHRLGGELIASELCKQSAKAWKSVPEKSSAQATRSPVQ